MGHKYPIGTLVYSKYDCMGMIIAICGEPYKSKYLVEWHCRDLFGSYTEEEIECLRNNLLNLMEED